MSVGTKKHPIRIPDALWEAAQKQAEAEGTSVSEAIRQFLTTWTAA